LQNNNLQKNGRKIVYFISCKKRHIISNCVFPLEKSLQGWSSRSSQSPQVWLFWWHVQLDLPQWCLRLVELSCQVQEWAYLHLLRPLLYCHQSIQALPYLHSTHHGHLHWHAQVLFKFSTQKYRFCARYNDFRQNGEQTYCRN
jgi:hypothetical protein